MTLDEADRMCEALAAPRGGREERALRKLLSDATGDGEKLTSLIAAFVRQRGYQPWKQPEALPPIDLEEITLVVWMAIDAATSGDNSNPG